MNRRDDADEKVQPHPIAWLEAWRHGLRPDARNARLAVGLVGERVGDIVRELTVNADRLQAVDDGFARSFKHRRMEPASSGDCRGPVGCAHIVVAGEATQVYSTATGCRRQRRFLSKMP